MHIAVAAQLSRLTGDLTSLSSSMVNLDLSYSASLDQGDSCMENYFSLGNVSNSSSRNDFDITSQEAEVSRKAAHSGVIIIYYE